MQETNIKDLTSLYYSRKDVQQAIYDFCKNRETVPNFNMQAYGKRPDALDYPTDIIHYAKKGATSFHCSEELWEDPLEILTDMTPEQYNEIRIGWDFLIDIDSKYLDYSKIAARLIIKALEHHGVKNIGLKFSGSKGFHLIIPWKAFPEEINDQKTKDMFPEWPRAIAGYIDELIEERLTEEIAILSGSEKQLQEIVCKICNQKTIKQKVSKYLCDNCKTEMQKIQELDSKKFRKTLRCPSCNFDMSKVSEEEMYMCSKCQTNSQKNPENFEKKLTSKEFIDSVDIILVAPRHLFRCPYSLHEKTRMASIVIDKDEIENFKPQQADPLKIQIKNFYPVSEKEEARELLVQALDWQKKQKPEFKKQFKGSIDIKGLTITEDIFPDSVKKILQGIKQDGRKRALSLLLSFSSSLEFPRNFVEEIIEKWNKKNYKPLKRGYVKSQIDWHLRNKRMPPNYDKAIYRDLGILSSNEAKEKNPVSFTIKQAFRLKRKNSNSPKPLKTSTS